MDEYQTVLLEMQFEIERRLEAIRQDMRHINSPISADSEERAQESENDEVLDALDEEGRETLANIKHALARIESGDYFDCERCGDEIAPERLKSVPYTNLCLRCAEAIEKENANAA